MPTYINGKLTHQEVERRLMDASSHFSQGSAEYNQFFQRERLKRIALTADSLKENLKEKSGGTFGLDLEGAIKTAQKKIRAQQGIVGTSREEIRTYIRYIEGYTKIKYILAVRTKNYPQCPLLR